MLIKTSNLHLLAKITIKYDLGRRIGIIIKMYIVNSLSPKFQLLLYLFLLNYQGNIENIVIFI